MDFPQNYDHGLLCWRDGPQIMSVVVLRYINRKPLHTDMIELLRSYFLHWINYPGFAFRSECDRENLILQLSKASTEEELRAFQVAALEFGIMPLQGKFMVTAIESLEVPKRTLYRLALSDRASGSSRLAFRSR